MKRIIIKLTGAAAFVAATKCIELNLDDAATFADLIHQMAKLFPSLIGLIIDRDERTMLSSNMFVVNGQDYVMVGMWDQSPRDGDHLLLISPITGG